MAARRGGAAAKRHGGIEDLRAQLKREEERMIKREGKRRKDGGRKMDANTRGPTGRCNKKTRAEL